MSASARLSEALGEDFSVDIKSGHIELRAS
jgi:hypothetical protein